MKRNVRGTVSIVLLIAIIMNICSGLVLAETANTNTEDWKKYSIFSANEGKDISISCWKSTINGNMYTGKDFVFNGSELYLNGICSSVGKISTNGWKMNITERNENAEKIDMPRLGDTIREKALSSSEKYCTDKSFNANEINLSEPIISDGDIAFNGTRFDGEGYVIAKENITYNVSWLDTGDDYYSVLYSENGDIIINGSSITINGILYAPNGKVQFNVSTLNLNGRIVADNIVFSGSQFNINGNDSDWDMIVGEEKTPISKIYTSSGDFNTGNITNMSTENDMLILNGISDLESSGFEKNYSKDDGFGTGIKINQVYNKTQLTNEENDISIKYNLSGFGQIETEKNTVDLVIVVDRSYSMDGGSYDNAKLAIKDIVNGMKSTDRCALITYAGKDLIDVQCDFESDKGKIKKTVDEFPGLGSATATFSALTKANELFEQNGETDRQKVIILLSDGDDNSSPLSTYGISKTLGENNIRVYAIGIGSELDREKMEQIAIDSKGIYMNSPSSNEIGGIMNYMATEVFDVAGRQVKLQIKIAKDVSLDSVNPEPAEIIDNNDGTQTISWNIDKILMEEEKTIDITVGVKGGEKTWCDIFTDTYLLFYDKEGNPIITYLDDIVLPVSNIAENGTWSVIYDSEMENINWKNVCWNGKIINDSSINIYASVSNDNVTYSEPIQIRNNKLLSNMVGRYIKIDAELNASTDGQSPIVYDISVYNDVCEDIVIENQSPQVSLNDTLTTKVNKYIKVIPEISDDTLNNDKLEFQWSCDDTNAEIKDVNSCITGVVFKKTGSYVLNLKVSDGENSVEKAINIIVEPNENFDKIESEIKEGLSVQLIFPEDGVEPYKNNTIKVEVKGGSGSTWSSVKLNGKYIELDENNEFKYRPGNVCSFTIDVHAYDTNGNSCYAGGRYRTIGEDTVKPSVSLSVSSYKVILTKPVTITSSASDYVGIKEYSVTVNGEKIELDGNNRYTFTPSELGTYTVVASASDEAGNVAAQTKTIEVVKDYINPSANMSLSSNTAAVGETVTIYNYAYDNIAVDRMELFVNGEMVELDENNRYYYQTKELGEIAFVLNVYDAEGNVGTAAKMLKVTTDMTEPKVNISYISSFVAGKSSTFTVTATDNIGVTDIKVYAGDVLLEPDDNGKYTVTSEVSGTVTITAYAYDAEGNVGTNTRSITVNPDTTTPNINISYVSSTTVGKTIKGKITASDNVAVTKVEAYIDGEPLTLDENGEYTYMTTYAGTLTIKAVAYDKAGNCKEAARTFNVSADTSNPYVYLSVNKTSGYIGNEIVVTSYAEDNVEVAEFKADLNGEVILFDENNKYTFTATNGGIYTVTVTATDKSGNITTKTRDITIIGDTVAPSINCSVLPTSELYVGQTATIKVSVTDNVAVDKYSVLINDKEIILDENNCYNFTVEEAGKIVILITASDTSGNERTYTRTLTAKADTAAPTVNLTVDKEIINKGESVILGVTATDNVAVAKIEAAFNDIPFEFDGNSAEITPECSGNIVVKVYDKAGNVGKAEKQIVVNSTTSNPDIPDSGDDYVKPEVSITANYKGDDTVYIPQNENITVYVSAKDNKGISYVKAYFDGEERVLDENGSFEFDSGDEGIYIVKAEAFDEAGNKGYAEKKFYVITENTSNPPKTDIITPKSGDDINGIVEISGTVSDDDLVKYELAYSPNGTDNFVVFAEGKTNAENAVLGSLDTSLLSNGIYDIKLTAYDMAGNSAGSTVSYIVSGNLKLGNFSISFDDMDIPVNNMPLTVTRTYDSRNRNIKGDFGYGWDMTLSNIKVECTEKIGTGWYQTVSGKELNTQYNISDYRPHRIIVTYPNGESDKFRVMTSPNKQNLAPIYTAKLVIIPEDGTTSELEFLSDEDPFLSQSGEDITFYDDGTTDVYNPAGYKLTTKEGVEYILSLSDGIEKITDTNGNTLTFTKDGIIHSDGKSIVFERDSENRIVSITDPMGESVKYGYDAYGDLVAVSDRMDNIIRFTYDENHYLQDIISADGVRVGRNEYDDNGRFTATIDADGNRIEYTHNTDDRCEIVKNRLGYQTVYYYDDKGNVTKEVDPYGNEKIYSYDENGNKTSETDALGNITSYVYDNNNNMVKMKNAAQIETYVNYDSRGKVLGISDLSRDIIKFTYDESGNILSGTDAEGNATNYNYDDAQRLSGISDKIGTMMTISYDDKGNVSSMKDPSGATAVFSYDENGRCTSRSLTRETENGVKTLTDVYTYDENGNVTSIVDNMGNRSTTEYNSFGKVAAVTDSRQNRTEYTYDKFGNLTKIIYPDNTTELFEYDLEGQNTSSTDRNGVTVKYEYDKLGRQIKTVYPNGKADEIVYDAAGRAIREIRANGAAVSYEYDSIGRNTAVTDECGNITKYVYNDQSMLSESIDAKGNSYKMEYDKNGNRTMLTMPDGTVTKTEYDERGRVLAVTDQMGYKTAYTYDNADNLIKVTTPDGCSWNYGYDLQKNLTSVTDPLGNTTRYEYDDLSRLVKTTLPMGMSKTQTYDSVGNMTSVTDFNGNTVDYIYDNMNQLVSVQYSDGSSVSYTYDKGRISAVTDKNGTMTYSYNGMGLLDKKVLYDGTEISYSYDDNCNISKITTPYSETSYDYDMSDRIIRVVDRDGYATLYEYDANGNRSAVRHANGIVTTYDYDSLNRLIKETISDSEGNVAEWYKYTLDPSGNRTKAEEYTGAVSEYEYDNCYRLIKETRVDSEHNDVIEYSYDSMYNRVSKTENGAITEYEYDANNRLIRQGNERLEYDNNGNLIHQHGGDAERTYTYNQNNQLVKAVITDGVNVTSETYVYDCEGNRIEKTTNEVDVTKYIVDSNCAYANVLAELDGEGNVKCVYTYGDEILSQKRGDSVSFYLADGHGNVRMLAYADGNITDTYDYDAFGNLISKTGETENNYLYCGEQFDGTTGYYYLRARYMNPVTGTFTSMDSYAGRTADPVTLHKYLYANGNPVMNIDPSGNFSLGDISVSSAINSILDSQQMMLAGSMAIFGTVLLNAAKGEVIGSHMGSLGNNVQEILTSIGGWAYTAMLVEEMFQTYSNILLFSAEYAKQIIKFVEKIETAKKVGNGDTSVYLMRDPNRNNNVVYVGISNDPIRREGEHKNDPKHLERKDWKMTVIFSGLKRLEARMMEQALICAYTKKYLDNARYEIARKNYSKFSAEMETVASLLKSSVEDLNKNILR